MDWTLDELLKLVSDQVDRQELLQLSERHRRAVQGRAPASECDAIVDQAMDRVHWHFRAIRHPMPTRQDVEKMLAEGA